VLVARRRVTDLERDRRSSPAPSITSVPDNVPPMVI
jgi:hypothetical protein